LILWKVHCMHEGIRCVRMVFVDGQAAPFGEETAEELTSLAIPHPLPYVPPS
jgi:hypothetical protein